MGHLIRSIRFLKEIRNRGRDAFLYIPDPIPHFDDYIANSSDQGAEKGGEKRDKVKEDLYAILLEWGLGPECCRSDLRSFPKAIIITDLRACSAEEFSALSSFPLVIGLDEGGAFRDHFPYLIDLIPGEGLLSKANVLASPVLPVPPLPLTSPQEPLERAELSAEAIGSIKILLSFGGEDPEELSSFVVALLIETGLASPGDITILRGPGQGAQKQGGSKQGKPKQGGLKQEGGSQGRGALPAEVREIGPFPDIRPLLANSDLLVSSYGLTAWEAVSLGVPLLLCNPSAYHEKLSRINGFISLGAFPRPRSKRDRAKARRLLFQLFPRGVLPKGAEKLKGMPEMPSYDVENPLDLILEMEVPEDPSCPLCGERALARTGKVLYRDLERTFKLCPSCRCGVPYSPFQSDPSYEKEYFTREYKNQYGRDYLEDFPFIKKSSFPRLEKIDHLLGETEWKKGGKGKTLLDIGCAYGPFLSAALEKGYAVCGIEISAAAADKAADLTGAPVFNGSALDLLKHDPAFSGENLFDVLTLWYVIEHLPRVDELMKEIKRILKPGGVLAISTPSFLGISGRKEPKEFFRSSPIDHLFVMEPRQAIRFFTDRGFSYGAVRFPSLHPDRFPFPWNRLPRNILSLFSRLGRLGDTFELYLVHGEKGGRKG